MFGFWGFGVLGLGFKEFRGLGVWVFGFWGFGVLGLGFKEFRGSGV